MREEQRRIDFHMKEWNKDWNVVTGDSDRLLETLDEEHSSIGKRIGRYYYLRATGYFTVGTGLLLLLREVGLPGVLLTAAGAISMVGGHILHHRDLNIRDGLIQRRDQLLKQRQESLNELLERPLGFYK